MKKRIYPVLFTETAGAVLAEVPDLEILTEGTDMADAIEMARDAIGQRGVLLEDRGETLRAPSSMETIHPENGTFAEDGKTIVSLVDVDFEEYRRKNDNKMVRRNVTIPNWMDREAAREKINVSGVLREALAERLQANR